MVSVLIGYYSGMFLVARAFQVFSKRLLTGLKSKEYDIQYVTRPAPLKMCLLKEAAYANPFLSFLTF